MSPNNLTYPITFFSQGLALAMIGGMTKKDCTDPTDKGEFCWSESTKAVLLGCYFYGYCLQVIPTTIAKKLGEPVDVYKFQDIN